MNDDEIINLFLKRDENGIIELSTKCHPYCYKIAWNLLANREDAEECLNDTWFSVWSQIPPVSYTHLVDVDNLQAVHFGNIDQWLEVRG